MSELTLLRRLRIETGLTSAEFARYAGVSTDAMSRWERGENVPKEANARKLARCLNALRGDRPRVSWEELR